MALVTTYSDWLVVSNPIARFCQIMDKDGNIIRYVSRYNNKTKEVIQLLTDKEERVEFGATRSFIAEGSRIVFKETVVATDQFLDDQKSVAPIKLEA